MPAIQERYDNYLAFYERVYGGSLIEQRSAAGAGCVYLSAQAAGDWSDASIPQLALGTVVSGRGSYSADLGAGRYRSLIRPRETILVAPNAGSYIVRDAPHVVLFLEISYRDLVALADGDVSLPRDGNFGRLHAGPLNDPLIPLLLKRIWTTAKAPAPGNSLFNQGVLLTIAGILTAGKELPRKRTSTGGLAPSKLKRVLDLLDAEVDGDISLERLAREVCMSTFHFARAFKQSTDLSPHRYLMRVRIERACRLLETTRLSVPDIGLAVGYSDPSYLARVFRCALGVTPNEYRKRQRS